MRLPAIKGMIFDKSSLCYYPIDTGPYRPPNVVHSLASLTDAVLFKLHLSQSVEAKRKRKRPKLLNVIKTRLLRKRKS